MTPTEYKIVNFIEAFFAQHHYSPPLAEIMHALGHKSKGTIHRYLSGLVNAGELTKSKESGRTVYQRPQTSRQIPLVGRIAAGRPIDAIPEAEQQSFFDRFQHEGLYQLEIRGDSMQDIGITEGDIVLIKPTRQASNGQIVVALIDGSEATLKRFHQRGEQITLSAENSQYPPLVYAQQRVEIQGLLHSVHKFQF